MNVIHNGNSPGVKKKRRLLSPEKKFQIFLESQTGKTPTGELLRREGIYSTDLARIASLWTFLKISQKGTR